MHFWINHKIWIGAYIIHNKTLLLGNKLESKTYDEKNYIKYFRGFIYLYMDHHYIYINILQKQYGIVCPPTYMCISIHKSFFE